MALRLSALGTAGNGVDEGEDHVVDDLDACLFGDGFDVSSISWRIRVATQAYVCCGNLAAGGGTFENRHACGLDGLLVDHT